MDYMNHSVSGSLRGVKSYMGNTNTSNNLQIDKQVNREALVKNYAERDVFYISNKFVANEEWDSITALLSRSTNFHTLAISGINIDSYGLRKVAEIIGVNKTLKTLKLEWNYLNEYNEELDFLCNEIVKAKSLIYIHLNNNKLSSFQIGSICNIIQAASPLLMLDLRWNDIGSDGGRDIVTALSNNTTIQEVNLTGNNITQEIIFELNDKLNRNKNYSYNTHITKEQNRTNNYNTEVNSLHMSEYLLNQGSRKFQSNYLHFFRTMRKMRKSIKN